MAQTAPLVNKLRFLICPAVLVLTVMLPAAAQVSENSSGQLRSLQDEEGTFLLNYANGMISSQVTASDENMILRMMDSLSRVQREVFWNKEYTAIEKEVTYQYQGDRVIAAMETQWYPASKKLKVLTYAESGLLVRQEEYTGGESAGQSEKRTLESTRTWKWDSQGRLVEECVTTESRKRTDRTEYMYQDGIPLPDENTYENDVLVREVIRDDDVRYTEYVYFGDAQVVSQYEDGILINETMLMNGKETRSRTW